MPSGNRRRLILSRYGAHLLGNTTRWSPKQHSLRSATG